MLLPALLAAASSCKPVPRIEILSPRRGEVVAGDQVTVRWRLVGADQPAGSHYHVFLDRDLPAAGEPIPFGDPWIVHLAGDETTFTFRGVEPGVHRVTVVLGDAAHRSRSGIYRASVPFRTQTGP